MAGLVRELLAGVVRGRDAIAVPGSWTAMVGAIRNLGRPGVASMAISAVDSAVWDLKARLLGLPLVTLLGALRDEAPVYGSGGFTSYSVDRLREQLGGWVGAGIPRVEMKIGRRPPDDPDRVRAARDAIGPDAELFVDANGVFSWDVEHRRSGRIGGAGEGQKKGGATMSRRVRAIPKTGLAIGASALLGPPPTLDQMAMSGGGRPLGGYGAGPISSSYGNGGGYLPDNVRGAGPSPAGGAGALAALPAPRMIARTPIGGTSMVAATPIGGISAGGTGMGMGSGPQAGWESGHGRAAERMRRSYLITESLTACL